MNHQSDPDLLKENISKLKETDTGVYSFYWLHPIKIPLKKSKNNTVRFWDRKNNEWIDLEPVIVFPSINEFNQKNISLIPEENNVFLLIASSKVLIKKIDDKFALKIKVEV